MMFPIALNKKILCLGIANADTYAKSIDKIPKWNTLSTFDEIKFSPGGCAINTAINLTSLGLKTGVSAAIGNDMNGKYIIQELKKRKINTENIFVKNKSTASTFAMLSSKGKRRYLVHWGANDLFTAKDIKINLIKNYSLIHFCGTFVMKQFDGKETLELAKKIKKNKILISIDTVFNNKVNCLKLIKNIFPYIDIFFPSIEELNLITGYNNIKKNIDFLKSTKIPFCGVKLGREGSIFIYKNEAFYCSPFKVKVSDTSGAGDAFMGGLIYSILKKKSLNEIMIFATACAAVNIKHLGASGNLPKSIYINKFINLELNTPYKRNHFIRNIN